MEENTVVTIENISSIEIKYKYGNFHLISVIAFVFIITCISIRDIHYTYYRIYDKYLFFLTLIISACFVLVHMIFDGFIINRFPDKKIRIINNDGTSVYIPIIARQKGTTKKDMKKILESVKETNPDINIKDTSILEMIVIILICLSMIVIPMMNLHIFLQY